MEIRRVTTADDELVAAFARLIPQLSQAAPPSKDALAAIARDAILLVAIDGEIFGALTLTMYRIPTGLQARIDDVVVDGEARGRGVGEALSREAIRLAREAGARSVHLTSRPSREAANRLYRRIGFEPVDTNVYRYRL
jgi:ribosomal protein S18 acetylase RimI-like enzyme